MGTLKCILIRMTSFGSGLRLRSFFFALVVSLFYIQAASAALFYTGPLSNSHFSTPAAACAETAAGWGPVNLSYLQSNLWTCGNSLNVQGTGSCDSGTTYNSSTGACDNPQLQKCTDAKGATEKNYSWHQSTDTPIPPSLGGCATTIGTISLCKPSSTGGFDCNADVTVTGEVYIPPPTPEPTPDPTPDTPPGTGDTGTGTGTGDTGS
ncbi:hypothetical protein, partial [Pseudomonas ficuserectae]|uniref:hypothetical protein n=1 Tax=Pseudomonas ficuserectae TaxID=53410 RepID=UPI001604E125